MLKQPSLLSRILKLRASKVALAEEKDLAALPENVLPKDSETAAPKQEESEKTASKPKESEAVGSKPEESKATVSLPEDVKAKVSTIEESKATTSKLEASKATVSKSEELKLEAPQPDNTKEVPEAEDSPASSLEAATATTAVVAQTEKPTEGKDSGKDTKSAVLPKGRKFKLPKLTTTRAAIAFGVLAALSGAVVPRVMSPAARASIAAKLALPESPVSSPGDPVADPLVTTGNLYVTNQILYRKLEAIAGVTLTNPADRVAPTLPQSSTPTAEAGSEANDASGSKPSASTAAAGAKPNSDSKDEKEADKPDPDVNVTAAAPPAPVADPVVFSGVTIDSVLEMRVAVAKDVSGIGFATSGNGVITDLDGNDLQSLSPETGVLAEDSGGLVVDGARMPDAFWVYPEDGGYVAVGDSWYRGRMLIARRERGLIAVNYVLLGDYLYSVVGTEVSPTWPIESLKAQAVAARSYALTHNIHPASEDYFDLDNTQRFQAYKGISREANTTQAAVQATAGEFISHDGGIVESLYAASQAIVDDAHSGSGMSQLGAKDLAEQGYSYQEILAHYYPGTALGRLETDKE